MGENLHDCLANTSRLVRPVPVHRDRTNCAQIIASRPQDAHVLGKHVRFHTKTHQDAIEAVPHGTITECQFAQVEAMQVGASTPCFNGVLQGVKQLVIDATHVHTLVDLQ